MNRKLKIGIIGAGVFGAYHAEKCQAHPKIDLIGMYDHTPTRLLQLTAKRKTQAYSNFDTLLNDVEAVIIASPAQTHGAMAIRALKAGKHCLIEKPIAASLEDAAKIVNLAKSKALIVQVGHQERFVVKAIGLDKIAEKPLSVTTKRMNRWSKRGTDVSVTLDLMVHDLDLLIYLMGETPMRLNGHTQKIRSDKADASLALLEFPSGSRARLEASRVEADYERVMDVIYPSGGVRINFNAKTLSHNTPFNLKTDFANDPLARDSLGAATNTFVEAVLGGKPVPITAEDGYKALEMALIIDRGTIWERNE